MTDDKFVQIERLLNMLHYLNQNPNGVTPQQLAKKFNVEAFPTTIVFDRGEVKQVVPGAQSADALTKLI